MTSTTRSASARLVTVPAGIPARAVSAAAPAASITSGRKVSRTSGWAETVPSGCQDASPPSRERTASCAMSGVHPASREPNTSWAATASTAAAGTGRANSDTAASRYRSASASRSA